MTRRTSAWLLLVLALSAAPAAAESPADVATARDLFHEGVALSRSARWGEARDRFSRSLELRRAPITLYSLGVVERELGDLVAALEHLRAFLAATPEGAAETYREPAERAVQELERRVARVTLVVTPERLRARVLVDGEALRHAALGRERLMNPGDHLVVVEAAGHRSERVALRLAEGERRNVTVALRALALPRDEAPAAEEPSFPIAPVTLLVAGGALFAAGLAVGLVGYGEAQDAPASDGPEADAARDKALAGDIVAGIGVAAAGAGLVWLIVLVASDEGAGAQRHGLVVRF
jgi:hypothetical protein